MRKLQRMISLLLCIAMIVPAQGLPVYAQTSDIINEGAAEEAERDNAEELDSEAEETESEESAEEVSPSEDIDQDDDRISDILPLETLEEEEDRIAEIIPLESLEEEEGDRITEVLPLEIIEDDRISGDFALEALDDDFTFEETVIYWNPGGAIPKITDYEKENDDGDSVATSSDAYSASRSGRNSRNIAGLTPYKPVKTLKEALKRAEHMQEEGVDSAEITIYVMNPMEIKDGELYILNAGNIRLVSWPGRSYNNDSLFYINGGQLTLINATLESGSADVNEEDAELIYMRGGTLQMGQNVTVNGRIVMDYRSKVEELDWQESASKDNSMMVNDSSADAETAEAETSEQEVIGTEETAEAETSEQEIADTAEVETSEQELIEIEETTEAETSEQEIAETSGAETSELEIAETSEAETSEQELTKTSDTTDATEVPEDSEANNQVVSKEDTKEVIVTTETTSGDPFVARIRKTDLKRIEFFNISNYTFDTDEDSIEMIRDTKTASTWRKPIIELLEDFGSNNENYLLDVRGDEETSEVELVKTLYADGHSEEEFEELFTLLETSEETWNLFTYSEIAASVRNTDSDVDTFNLFDEDFDAEDEIDAVEEEEDINNGPGAIMAIPGAIMTQKTLIATRNSTGETVYWNPGPAGTYDGGKDYNKGDDSLFDGTHPGAPVKTWKKAVELAKGGTIIVMNSVDLSKTTASEYLTEQSDGSFLVSSDSPEFLVTVIPWSFNIQPAFIVGENKTLVLKDVKLKGSNSTGIDNETENESAMVEINKGNVIIEKNVTAESGYINVISYDQIENTPIKVTSTDSVYDGKIKLFYTDINKNLSYRFKDVIVPYGDLQNTIEEAAEEEKDNVKAAVGEALLKRMVLHPSHRDDLNGGSSKFDWILRQDTAEDDNVKNAQNLELYTTYYYNAIYLDGDLDKNGNDRGNDNYLGAACEYPVKTWTKAAEIWKKEMEKSISARVLADGKGLSAEEINLRYPLPDVIYICGTVTVDSLEPDWELAEYKDYNGEPVKTEVRAHTDIPKKGGSAEPVHDIPKVLVKVVSGGELTIKNVLFRNTTDDKDSDTIQVEGGKLEFTGAATLTGELEAEGLIVGKPNTYGDHVVVSDGGTFTMANTWEGSIMRRQHGVTASGSGTKIIMNGGQIRENNSFDQVLYDAKDINQLKGAGVVITDGAAFTMNGGEIKENTVYQYGAGVYLDGNDTSFEMNKGKISDNKVPYEKDYKDSRDYLTASGIGVYGGAGTKISIGNGITPAEDVLINGNNGFVFDGGGVGTEGDILTINQATVSNNFSNGSAKANLNSRGIGIYAGTTTEFKMDDSNVTGNYGLPDNSAYGIAHGAGIYITSTKDNYIKDSKISNNEVGYENNRGFSNGGGIYAAGKLDIENTEIFGNKALEGGGIHFAGTILNISNTHIYSNIAKGFQSMNSGLGGGIYVEKGDVIIKDGTIIGGDNESEGNYSDNLGGGIYQAGGTLTLEATSLGKIKVNNNHTSKYIIAGEEHSGAGIYSKATLKLDKIEIAYNKTSDIGSGGGIYSSSASTITNSIIENNNANNGAGIYKANGDINLYNTRLAHNIAKQNGGGYYGRDATGYFKLVTIEENQAVNGGGIYILCNYSKYNYFTDCIIQKNSASDKGGGAYLKGYVVNNTSIRPAFNYFTETTDGLFVISDNTAEFGGGIYTDSGIIYMDIAGPFINTAATQGSNLYLSSVNNWILQGDFRQPDPELKEGIYNVYVNVIDTSANYEHSVYWDPVNVTVEKKKNTASPDVIYLETANSFLTYLSQPPGDGDKTLPVDLHKDNFKVGSVVIKPAKLTLSIPFFRVNSDGTGLTDEYHKEFTELSDATENIKYSSGGKLPRRSQLGGYNKNVVVIGEGVYLASTGKDTNEGTSPDDAVATFDTAQKILAERIEKADLDVNNTEGFSPFIYISDTVNVFTTQNWELDYTASKFASEGEGAVNTKYAEAESFFGAPVYKAQIRRFASFVNNPLIVVGDNADLKTGRIIIDGMLEAVLIREQEDKSPLVKINNGSTVTLTGNSRLTNNYYSGVEVHGKLILEGEEGEENKQLLNIEGYYVDLCNTSSLEMNGYSRIIAEGKVVRRGRNSVYGVNGRYSKGRNENPNVSIVMKENSKIEKVIETVDGEITEATLMTTGISVTGVSDSQSIKMQNEASVVNAAPTSINDGAITINGNVTMELEDSSSIIFSDSAVNKYNGIAVGINNSLVMKDNSKIENSSNGIYLRSFSNIEMQDFAKIVNASDYGVYFNEYAMGSFRMNMNNNANDGDSAKIEAANGFYFGTNKQMDIYMGKHALVSRGDESKMGSGIYYRYNGYSPSVTQQFHMMDYSRITGFEYGVFFLDYRTPIEFIMQNYAAIDENKNGVSEFLGMDGGVNYLSFVMLNNSRISGNSEYGFNLGGAIPFEENSGKYHKITLKDDAIIGENGKTGILANSPLQLEMSGKSKITGNGDNDDASKNTTNGIYLTRDNNVKKMRVGVSKISLSDSASICNNRGGVYIAPAPVYSNLLFPNPCEITLKGTASIEGNTDAVYIMDTDQKIELKEYSRLGGSLNNIALDNYGYMMLDGRSTIEGLVYLRDFTIPITMTHGVVDSIREYHLWLAEGFLGNVVVQPDGAPGGMTDVTGELDHFIKEGAEGLADQKELVNAAPNIILQGDNNVYLAGNGNDENDGNSPITAVKTFKRAKELLENGLFTEGANIIICKEVVNVLAEDNNWSFDSEGKVKNNQSGDRWTPKVIRYKDYKGNLIGIKGTEPDYASEVTFRNIVIDGGGDENILSSSGGVELLYVGKGGTAYLKEGAVLQNNKLLAGALMSSRTSMGVKVHGGTLEIDGGIIRNMSMERADIIYTSSDIGSAIYCMSNNDYPGKVIMKSGQIVNNTIDYKRTSSWQSNFSTIYLDGSNSEMVMSGGVIENNINTFSLNVFSTKAAAVLVDQSNFHMDGGIIRGNTSYRGSAIHYVDNTQGSLVISGGLITGNETLNSGKAKGHYSPIYIEGKNFQLKGGGADIRDNIYLSNLNYNVKVSGRIYQTGRVYNLYLGNDFGKGSIVAQPDGTGITDAGPYLSYFRVNSKDYVLDIGRKSNPVGTVPGVAEKECLVLMKPIYLDSEGGNDNNDGLTPDKALKTFTRAKSMGNSGRGSASYYIIYITGKAINTSKEPTWSLPEPAYMCRYTGFRTYDDNGDEMPNTQKAYYGHLIEPAYSLSMDNLYVYGRRFNDTTASNGDSIIKIKPGINVTIGEKTAFDRNYNIGTYYGKDGKLYNLTSKGGAIFVDAGGHLSMSAGSIQDTEAAYGSAIYLEGSENDPAVYGKLLLTGSPVIAGKVYLGGKSTATAAYIEPDVNYKPEQALQIAVGNDYNGRPVISYTDGTIPGDEELEKYAFDDSIKGLYDIVNRINEEKTLELSMRKVIYLDGREGDDITGDGLTPYTAFKTLRKVYETIGKEPETKGVLVYIVDTVEISAATGEPANVELMNILVKETNGISHYEGYYKDDINGTTGIIGQVNFKRYAQPDGYTDSDAYNGFNKGTLLDTMFHVKDGGSLSINGNYIDGHSQDIIGSDVTLTAKGVTAKSPLIIVEGTGELISSFADKKYVENGQDTATILANNFNNNTDKGKDGDKEKLIGKLNESDIYEGSGGGIELLDGGAAYLKSTEFRNLKLGAEIFGGTDVYSNGSLHFSHKTLFSGTVYLEGLGTPDERDTSRYLTVDVYGTPVLNSFQVLMRDPYEGRAVVSFEETLKPTQTDAAFYLLEENVKDFFYLDNRAGEENILELHVPVAVYVDGSAGVDYEHNENDRAAGSTPKTPVRTLKRAYDLLQTRSGNTIYVVNTVNITGTTEITGNSYRSIGGGEGDGNVILGSTNRVKIVRYIQPDFARDNEQLAADTGYDVDDFTGVLLNVTDRANVEFRENIFFDGHSEPKTGTDYRMEAVVSRTSEAKAPMITVQENGTLNLKYGVTLQDNNNTYDAESNDFEGGAINNHGTTIIDGALFTNNHAAKGSAVYQDGEFTILGAPEKLENHSFYLTTDNTGTKDSPVWGTDHIIQVGAMIPDNIRFEIDMDHAVKGRDVIRFTDTSAYNPNADAEHDHFNLGSTVPEYLFLVEDKSDPFVLELQNWEILDVEVPQDIYLVVKRRGSSDTNTKLSAIRTEAAGDDIFSSPEYTIKNKGVKDVKVFVESFANRNIAAGITHDPMNLLEDPYSLSTNKDIYLAIKGLDDESGETGFTFTETPLKSYSESTVSEAPVLLGALKSGTDGNFAFVGAFGPGFVEKYMDSTFPIEGDETIREKAQQYMAGSSDDGIVNARAKYEMKYRIEIDPSRRNLPR